MPFSLAASDGRAYIVDGDDLRALAPTPLRWAERDEREPSVAWEIGDVLSCPPRQRSSRHAYAIGPGDEPELFPAPDEACPNLATAVYGRDGEVICVGAQSVVRYAFRAGASKAHALGDLPHGPARLCGHLLVWTQKEVVAFDLELNVVARRACDFIHDVAIAGDVAAIMLSREAVIVDANLEEYGRVALRGAPAKMLVDERRGWIWMTSRAEGNHVSLLDVGAGKVRWCAGAPGLAPGCIVRADDLLVAFTHVPIKPDPDEELAGHACVLNATYGGRVASLTAPFAVAEAIALPGARIACIWRHDPTAIADGQTAGVFVDPRNEDEPVVLDAHGGNVRGLSVDANGGLVTWGYDGVLARYDSSVGPRGQHTK